MHSIILKLFKGGFMHKMKFLRNVGIFLVLFIAFFISACSNKATEEQLQQLRDLRKQEKNLQEMIQSKQNEKASLERELNARKSELNNCEKNAEFVKQKLEKWPDVWPDWQPNK